MNPRIRKLAEQAGLEFDDDLVLEIEPVYFITKTDLEKFAQLVILNCAEVSSNYIGNVKALLLKHFGVEP